jgi:hypothetical protein
VVGVFDLRIVDDAQLHVVRDPQAVLIFVIGRNEAGAGLNRGDRRQFLLGGLPRRRLRLYDHCQGPLWLRRAHGISYRAGTACLCGVINVRPKVGTPNTLIDY